MSIDYQKLLAKLMPEPGGEDVARMRVGIVDAVNADGTVNLGIAGIIVPSIARLANAPMVAGTVVNVISYRGSLLILGPSASSANTLVQVSTHQVACTVDTTGALSPTFTDITGMTFGFVTTKPNAIVMASLVIDWEPNATNASNYGAFVNLDGTDVTSPQAIAENPTAGVDSGRRSGVQNYRLTVAAAGNHTLKGRCTRINGTGVILVKATHSTLTATVLQSQ
jgi:hypothetical protein